MLLKRRELGSPLVKGFLVGLTLQLAVGPVFFYVMGITMASDPVTGLAGALAVTLADAVYIGLSTLGVGKFLEGGRAKAVFSWVSSLVLLGFGLQFLLSSFDVPFLVARQGPTTWSPAASFLGCFALTISSPLTIVFWGSVFSAQASANQYSGRQMVPFGVGAGLATPAFLGAAVLAFSLFRSTIPVLVVQGLNALVGTAIVGFSLVQIVGQARRVLMEQKPKR